MAQQSMVSLRSAQGTQPRFPLARRHTTLTNAIACCPTPSTNKAIFPVSPECHVMPSRPTPQSPKERSDQGQCNECISGASTLSTFNIQRLHHYLALVVVVRCCPRLSVCCCPLYVRPTPISCMPLLYHSPLHVPNPQIISYHRKCSATRPRI